MIIYKEEELDLRPGDIILYRNEFILKEPMTYVSAAVRYFTNSYYNHCAIVVETEQGLMINEAIAEGIVSRPLEEHLERTKSKICVLRSKQPVYDRSLNDRAMSKVGAEYDFMSLIVYQVIYRTTGIWIGRKRQSAERVMVCSEYVAWVYSMPEWWLASVKEIQQSDLFEVVYQEK